MGPRAAAARVRATRPPLPQQHAAYRRVRALDGSRLRPPSAPTPSSRAFATGTSRQVARRRAPKPAIGVCCCQVASVLKAGRWFVIHLRPSARDRVSALFLDQEAAEGNACESHLPPILAPRVADTPILHARFRVCAPAGHGDDVVD